MEGLDVPALILDLVDVGQFGVKGLAAVGLERKLWVRGDHRLVQLLLNHPCHDAIDGFLRCARHVVLNLLGEFGAQCPSLFLLSGGSLADLRRQLLGCFVGFGVLSHRAHEHLL